MRKAGEKPDHWRATAWMLERRFPEKYGKKSPTHPDLENIKSESNSAGLVVAV